MLDSVSNTPLIDIKGENLNLIQINFDFWDVSTRESNPSGEISKCEKANDINNKSKKLMKQSKRKSITIKESDTILKKKQKEVIIIKLKIIKMLNIN